MASRLLGHAGRLHHIHDDKGINDRTAGGFHALGSYETVGPTHASHARKMQCAATFAMLLNGCAAALRHATVGWTRVQDVVDACEQV